MNKVKNALPRAFMYPVAIGLIISPPVLATVSLLGLCSIEIGGGNTSQSMLVVLLIISIGMLPISYYMTKAVWEIYKEEKL